MRSACGEMEDSTEHPSMCMNSQKPSLPANQNTCTALVPYEEVQVGLVLCVSGVGGLH